MQVETLLSKRRIVSFTTRDEQEVAGYAEAMDLFFLGATTNCQTCHGSF